MSHRLFVFMSVSAILAVSPTPAADSTPAEQPRSKGAPRTAWGAPDLRGIWDFRTITPLERPDELAGKEVLADREAAEYQRRDARTAITTSDPKRPPTTSSGPTTIFGWTMETVLPRISELR